MKKPIIISTIFCMLIAFSLIFVLAGKKANAPEVNSGSDSTAKENVSSLTSNDNKPGSYIDYSEAKLSDTEGQKILFFHASWCPQCRSIEKSILENKGSIPSGITIFKVDYDSNQGLRKKYGVTIQTTFVKIDDSGNLIDKYVAYDEPTIDAVRKNFLEK